MKFSTLFTIDLLISFSLTNKNQEGVKRELTAIKAFAFVVLFLHVWIKNKNLLVMVSAFKILCFFSSPSSVNFSQAQNLSFSFFECEKNLDNLFF